MPILCVPSDLSCQTDPVLRQVEAIHEFIFKKVFALLLLSYSVPLKWA